MWRFGWFQLLGEQGHRADHCGAGAVACGRAHREWNSVIIDSLERQMTICATWIPTPLTA